MALTEVVGRTGSGKSLWANSIVYDELTRIMNNGFDLPFYKPWLKYSAYDWVVLNFDFNDSRGNFTKFCKVGNECFCDNQYRKKWVFVGKVQGQEVLTEVEEQLFETPLFGEMQIAKVDHWEYGGFCIGADDFPEVYHIKNCLILFDEAGTRFSNRDWDKMPPGYLLYLDYLRIFLFLVWIPQSSRHSSHRINS